MNFSSPLYQHTTGTYINEHKHVLPTSPPERWYKTNPPLHSPRLHFSLQPRHYLYDPFQQLTNSPLGAKFTNTIHSDTYPAISSTSQSDLTGKSVFISGASRGIGRATALSYARAGAAQIAVAAPSGLEAIEQDILAAAASATRRNPPPQVLVLSLDVLDHSSVKAAAQQTDHAFGGKLDILVNNAGYLEEGLPIADSDPDDYWRTWEINYRGLYWLIKAFLPLLLRSEDGAGSKTVVNVSSMGALGLRPGGSAYQTTKFAILKFTEFVMAEYADQGVLCYAVHPGGVMTQLARNMPKQTHSGRILFCFVLETLAHRGCCCGVG